MGKMMKRFGRTMLTVMGLAVAAAVLSSIPAHASGPNVIANGFSAGVGWFTQLDPNNPFSTELVVVNVQRTAKTGYMLFYIVVDFGGGFSANGSGSIPFSSVNVSGGSVNTAKETLTLNVNTCGLDPSSFTTNYGPCGTFNLTWVEMPASIGGSYATRGDTQFTSPGGSKVTTNGELVNFGALVTGTALGYDAPTPTLGGLTQQTNVTVTVTP